IFVSALKSHNQAPTPLCSSCKNPQHIPTRARIVSSDTMKGGRVLPKQYGMPGHPRVCRSTACEPPHQMRARTLSLLLLMRSLQGAQPCPSHVSPPTFLAPPGVLATPASTTATRTAYGALCSCVAIAENSAVPKKMRLILRR